MRCAQPLKGGKVSRCCADERRPVFCQMSAAHQWRQRKQLARGGVGKEALQTLIIRVAPSFTGLVVDS